jgi:Fanconi anemia group M protein
MDFLKGITPREYQQKIFQTCKEKNCLVVLPTGLGKTLIALMLVIERMKTFPGQKAVFLAPTKPLAEQHLSFFTKHLPELFGSMELFTGKVKPEQRKKIWETADIIFSTPQCVANDIRKKLYDLKEVSLLIEDEAHRCVRNYDYNFIAKNYQEQSRNPRIMGLTASPGSDKGKIQEICHNLFVEEVELRTRESGDVKPYLQKLNFERVMIDFPAELEEIREVLLGIFRRYIDELKSRNLLFEPPTKTNLIKLQKKLFTSSRSGNFNHMHGMSACAQAVKIQHALELLETQTLFNFNKYLKNLTDQAAHKKSKGVVKLVAKPEFNFVFMKSNELLSKNFEHPKLQKMIEIVEEEKSKNPKMKIIVFCQFRDTAKIITNNLNRLEGIKARAFVGQAKKNTGDGTSGLSQKEQKKIIEEFSSGEINIIACTSIGEEGLDIPEVNAVIFYETVPSAIRKIQRSGRTARLMEGKLIMLVTRKTRDETHFYVSRAKERRMNSAIDSVKQDLKDKKQKNIKDYFKN